MAQLSAVILTLNEEKNIERALKSLDGVADEIVVVDSFSTDKTVEIAEEMGARVIKNHYPGQIEQHKFATSQASYDHILNLDADEALSDELKKSIEKIKANWEFSGYPILRTTFYCGAWIKFGSASKEFRLRLVDRTKTYEGGTNPHISFEIKEGKMGPVLEGPLLHFRFRTISEHVDQVNFQSSAAAQAAYEAGQSASLVKIIFKPGWIFFRDYFLRLGFLEGRRGLALCAISSWEFFLRWLKLWELRHVNGKN